MKKKKREYSKSLLTQESALIWILTLSTLGLAFFCIKEQFMGPLPWLATMVTCAWAAYGVSQVFYYRKSLAENTAGGIKYDTVLKELDKAEQKYTNITQDNMNNTSTEDFYSYTDNSTYDIPEEEYQI